MKVEHQGRMLPALMMPARFGRSRACELILSSQDRTVPNLLGQIHLIDDEIAVTNLHQRGSFQLVAGRDVHRVGPGVTVRIRHREAVIRSASGSGWSIRILLESSEIRPRLRRLDGPKTNLPRPTFYFKDGHLRDLAALYEPTLVGDDFSVIRAAPWQAAAARIGDRPSNLKARVLRTIASQAEDFGCPSLDRDVKQVLGRWLIDSGILTRQALQLLDDGVPK